MKEEQNPKKEKEIVKEKQTDKLPEFSSVVDLLLKRPEVIHFIENAKY